MSVKRNFALDAFVLPALIACGSNGVEAFDPLPTIGSPESGSPSPPALSVVHGRYVGTVTIDQVEYFADALFAPNGEARIYFGEAGGGAGGAIPDTRADTASQFVGQLNLGAGQATGSGFVIGEGCAVSALSRFCQETAAAEIRFPGASAGFVSDLEGSIAVTSTQGVEVWSLELRPWHNFYSHGILLENAAGQYVERIAEFVADEDTVIVIDETGQLFFQSAASGCSGNGVVTPDADFNVLAISLTIEACSGGFAYLNGDHSGLGTFSTSDFWNYDSVLRMWLSKSGAEPSQAALTMWGSPIYD